MRTITHSEFQAASGDPVYVSTVHYASRAEREAGDAAVQRVVVAAAFTPFGHAGEPQDPPEEWPSDKTASDYPTGAESGGVTPRLPNGRLDPEALQAAVSKVREAMPPPCDFTSHGEALAHAQHKAAEGGEGCDSVACSITQGVSD